MRVIVPIPKLFLHKDGNQENEYEDAMCARSAVTESDNKVQCYRFAVADGATESIFSGLWANILVDKFTSGDFDGDLSNISLKSIQDIWKQKSQECMGYKVIPWYLEEKLREGSYAALAGLILYPSRRYAKLKAIGDSCIFRIRGEKIISFPPLEYADFNSRPQLLGTVDSIIPSGFLKEAEWDLLADDTFLLMTDALAAWFMQKQESGENNQLIDILAKDDSEEEKLRFNDKIQSERKRGRLKNDDVTLMIIRVVDD